MRQNYRSGGVPPCHAERAYYNHTCVHINVREDFTHEHVLHNMHNETLFGFIHACDEPCHCRARSSIVCA